jgi:hypothetical protein
MIKKKGCGPCKIFEPTIKEVALKNSLKFKTIQAEEMPTNLRPDVFPYFYLMQEKTLLESWAGTNTRKMQSVLKRHINDVLFD